MNLGTLLNNMNGSYRDFAEAVLQYAKKKPEREEAVLKFLKEHPDATTSDVVKFVSDQPDFFEEASFAKIYYKGYYTIPEYEPDDCTIHGTIEGISDFVNYSTNDIAKVEEEFRKAVDEYLEFCKSIGKMPETPCQQCRS